MAEKRVDFSYLADGQFDAITLISISGFDSLQPFDWRMALLKAASVEITEATMAQWSDASVRHTAADISDARRG